MTSLPAPMDGSENEVARVSYPASWKDIKGTKTKRPDGRSYQGAICEKLNCSEGGLIDPRSEISGGLVVFWTSQTFFCFTRAVCGDHLRRGLIDYSLPDGRSDWFSAQLFNAFSTFDVPGRKVWSTIRFHAVGLVGSCRSNPAGLIDPRRNTLRL